MLWMVRLGAYALSSLAVWQFFQSSVSPTEILPIHKHLALDPGHSMIFGVCAGISNYTGIDVTLIRLAWALASLYRGFGVGVYLLAFIIMPTQVP